MAPEGQHQFIGQYAEAIVFHADQTHTTGQQTHSDLGGAGIRVEQFPVCDQYTLQANAFARAVLNETPWPYPIEDAVCNMRVIDAFFRSAESGKWESAA